LKKEKMAYIDKVEQRQMNEITVDTGVFPIVVVRVHQMTDTIRIEYASIDRLIEALQKAKKHLE
jgi:hypothetical protein